MALSGGMVMVLFRYMQKNVMTDPECVPPQAQIHSLVRLVLAIAWLLLLLLLLLPLLLLLLLLLLL